ncbi:hypothetical protein EDB85DRAFT_2214734 [Lactarius pseudohatsudake]|nr:hypothetical protein EDB85DRAFT_2214734 [Lactarius pseudohatsudake]
MNQVIVVGGGGALVNMILDHAAKHTPSQQKRRGDKQLEDARSLVLEYQELIHPSDREVVEEQITHAREMRAGLDTRWGFSELVQAREYHKAAKSAHHTAKTMSDRARDDARFTARRPDISLIPEMSDRANVTGVALSLCRIYLGCKDAFPTPQTKQTWEATVWNEACTKTGSNLELFMSFELANGSTKLFVDAKAKVMHVVEAQYGFDTSHAPESIGRNTSLAQALLSDMTFIYREPNPGGSPRHPYRHPGLQKAINITWFRDKEADGVAYHQHFSPVSIPAIAFILAVVECCIDEWTDGTHKETEWDEKRFKTVYQSHISSLDDFRRHAIDQGTDLFEHIRGDLLKEARKHAGVPPLPVTERGRFSRGALDAALQEDPPAYADQGLPVPDINLVSDDSDE